MLVLDQLIRNWWTFVLQGVIGILFGVLAIIQPRMTLEALVLLFAIWALVEGETANHFLLDDVSSSGGIRCTHSVVHDSPRRSSTPIPCIPENAPSRST